MSFLEHTINVADLPKDEMGDFSPIPDGEYSCTIKKCEIKETNDTTGEYFNFQLAINKVDCQQNRSYHQGGLLTMPLAWVIKIESLDDITCEKLLIPSEIILDIDLFV